jgi:hypothetical protein
MWSCIGAENPESKRERKRSIRSCDATIAVGVKSVCVFSAATCSAKPSTIGKNSACQSFPNNGHPQSDLFFPFWQIETMNGDGSKKYLALVAIKISKKNCQRQFNN